MDLIELEKEVARLRSHNLRLQRRLERSRRDALLYAASLCESHAVTWKGSQIALHQLPEDRLDNVGAAYGQKLREIAK